jgi:hypothetical protein
LQFEGAPVVVGEFVGNAPIAAEATATGYLIAWKVPGADQYAVWTTDSSGNYVSHVVGGVSGSNATLESLEPAFYQDLNADGVIGSAGTAIEVTGNVVLGLNPFTQAVSIDAGAALELTGAATGSVTFNGATGTLSLDQSSTFTAHVYGLTGNGNLAASDAIDLKDVKFASATVDPYAGNTAGGTLTVSDTQGHVAHISLVGDYTGSSFTLSPDSGGGTIVIDPPLAHTATVAASSGASVERASGVSLLPQHQAPGQASSDAAGAPNNALAREASATRISVAPISAATPATQFDTTTADYRTSREHPVAPGAAIGRPATSGDSPISSNAGTTSHGIGGLGGAPISHASGENAAPINAIAREVVSPNDLISAIKGGNIAIRFGGDEGIAAERQIWLFDDAQGAFVAPASKPLTIVLDHDRAPLSQAQSLDVSVGLLATAAMVSQEPLWLGALRQFGRKAARAIQQRTGWTE